jgi:hypothetical protein
MNAGVAALLGSLITGLAVCIVAIATGWRARGTERRQTRKERYGRAYEALSKFLWASSEEEVRRQIEQRGQSVRVSTEWSRHGGTMDEMLTLVSLYGSQEVFVQFSSWAEELDATFADPDAAHLDEHVHKLTKESAELHRLMKADIVATE